MCSIYSIFATVAGQIVEKFVVLGLVIATLGLQSGISNVYSQYSGCGVHVHFYILLS